MINALIILSGILLGILLWKIKFSDLPGAALAVFLLALSAIWGGDNIGDPICIAIAYSLVIFMAMFKSGEKELIYAKVSRTEDVKKAEDVIGKVLLPVIMSIANTPFALIVVLGHGVADSAGSQIGIFSRSNPRLITNLKPVPPGTNGAISMLGTTLGAILGMVVGIIYSLISGYPMGPGILWGLFGGLVGNLIDSLVGATVEKRFMLSDWSVNLLSGSLVILGAFVLKSSFVN
jgi:uncharacterized protein (TIGR00297 family)